MRVLKTWLGLTLCLALLISCGPTLINTPAKDMNLTAAEVGAGYVISEEEGLAELTDLFDLGDDAKDIKDANYRMFESSSGSIALSMVITLDKAATKSMLKELVDGFEEGFTGGMPGSGLDELKAPSLGDEATARGTEMEDFGISVYFVGFRKTNVIGVIAVVGFSEDTTFDMATQMATKMDSKIK